MPGTDYSPTLSKLNALFGELGTNPDENIQRIVRATGEILQGACTLFNRLDNQEQSLCAWAAHNAPHDLPESDPACGHICYEATITGQDRPVSIPDINETRFATTDPYVRRYGLRSYLGHPVRLQGKAIGALCIVDMQPREFSRRDIDTISTLAKAISLEEERKRIQDGFEKSRSMLEEMQSLAAIGGWEADPVTLKSTWTPEIYRILEITGTQPPPGMELLGMCAGPRQRRRVLAAMQRVRRGQSPQTTEFKIRTPRGTLKWIRASARAHADNGVIHKIFGSVQDITASKEAERALKRARDEAQAASTAKTEFLANMSHEVRTPLNGVLGMLQLTLRTELDQEQREYMDIALHSCRGLLTIINDLLDLSKIEAGKITLARDLVDLPQTVNAVVQGFRHQVADKDVNLSYSLDSRIPDNLVGDGGRLRQILFNLVGNAVKFTPSGTVRLDVTPLARNKDTAHILFSVSDTGVGIPDEALERIFEPFEQADTGLQRSVRGTGLGLGIVRKLVHLMGGTLTLASEQGKGTTIYASIPLGLLEAQEDEQLSPTDHAQGEGLNILLVEDNPVNRTAPKLFLEKLGNTVRWAEHGRQALNLMQENRFDVVFMDLEMPHMDGIETTKRIRAATDMATPASVPVIAITAFAFPADRKRCFDAGMDAFLTKPVDFKELEQIVRSIQKAPESRGRASENDLPYPA
jgi:signal transduction histidine kinase/ActR/RegA family two-component response regulator